MGICDSKPPPPNPNEIDLTHFELLKVVGKGGFGKVNAILNLTTQELLALKRMEKHAILQSSSHLKLVWLERKIMSMINSPFLCNLHVAFENETELFLVMPFMQGGDLRYHLREKGTMRPRVCQFYAAEMIIGLEHLHQHHILFRDLKPDNIMLDARGHIRISDFGLASITHASNNYQCTGQAGTRGYQSPEVVTDQSYAEDADMWSFGIVIYELLHGIRPWKDWTVVQKIGLLQQQVILEENTKQQEQQQQQQQLQQEQEAKMPTHPTHTSITQASSLMNQSSTQQHASSISQSMAVKLNITVTKDEQQRLNKSLGNTMYQSHQQLTNNTHSSNGTSTVLATQHENNNTANHRRCFTTPSAPVVTANPSIYTRPSETAARSRFMYQPPDDELNSSSFNNVEQLCPNPHELELTPDNSSNPSPRALPLHRTQTYHADNAAALTGNEGTIGGTREASSHASTHPLLRHKSQYSASVRLAHLSNFHISSRLDPVTSDFLRRVLHPDKRVRLGCGADGWDEMKQHEFFAGVNWEAVAACETKPPIQPDLSRANCTADADLADQLLDRKPREILPEQQRQFRGWGYRNILRRNSTERGTGGGAGGAADNTQQHTQEESTSVRRKVGGSKREDEEEDGLDRREDADLATHTVGGSSSSREGSKLGDDGAKLPVQEEIADLYGDDSYGEPEVRGSHADQPVSEDHEANSHAIMMTGTSRSVTQEDDDDSPPATLTARRSTKGGVTATTTTTTTTTTTHKKKSTMVAPEIKSPSPQNQQSTVPNKSSPPDLKLGTHPRAAGRKSSTIQPDRPNGGSLSKEVEMQGTTNKVIVAPASTTAAVA